MLWAGAVVDIPSGWHLCDGTVGTPDLRDTFVFGAGGDKAPDFTGGTHSHTHDFTGDGHSHYLVDGDNIIDSFPAGDKGVGTTSNNAIGETDSKSHYPPFYCLCYIMKL